MALRAFRRFISPTCSFSKSVGYQAVTKLAFSNSRCDTLPGKKASLVIFDKDGTLICFGAGWTDWTHSTVDTFSQKLKKPVEDELYNLFGYNKNENTWKEGLLCDVDENIITGLADFLVKHGMPREQAVKTAQDHFIINDHEGPGIIRAIDDPKTILETLRAYGVKTAICTADNTAGTNYMLDELKIHELFDFTLSLASHKERPAKPDPSNIHLICDRLGVEPKETVMVGDSLRDVEMGQLAGVKASVGVLSGVGCEEHLRKADYVVPSIKHVLDLVLPQGYEKKTHESEN